MGINSQKNMFFYLVTILFIGNERIRSFYSPYILERYPNFRFSKVKNQFFDPFISPHKYPPNSSSRLYASHELFNALEDDSNDTYSSIDWKNILTGDIDENSSITNSRI